MAVIPPVNAEGPGSGSLLDCSGSGQKFARRAAGPALPGLPGSPRPRPSADQLHFRGGWLLFYVSLGTTSIQAANGGRRPHLGPSIGLAEQRASAGTPRAGGGSHGGAWGLGARGARALDYLEGRCPAVDAEGATVGSGGRRMSRYGPTRAALSGPMALEPHVFGWSGGYLRRKVRRPKTRTRRKISGGAGGEHSTGSGAFTLGCGQLPCTVRRACRGSFGAVEKRERHIQRDAPRELFALWRTRPSSSGTDSGRPRGKGDAKLAGISRALMATGSEAGRCSGAAGRSRTLGRGTELTYRGPGR